MSTCENAEEMAAGWVDVRLFGPGGQVVSGAEVVLDGVAPHGDATLALQGQLELDAEGRIAVRTDDGHLWSIWLGAQGVPAPRLYPGELVTVHVRVQMAFAGWLVGIAIYGERGLLFAVDQGLSGLAATLPFDVTVTDVGCPPIDESGCSPRQAQGLRFVGEHQDFVLRTGEWGGLAALGYDVAVLNMQSFSTGYCDDYWHYAFAAYAIAGSDAGFCSLEPPPTVCEQAQQKLEDCYGYAGGQQYGLSWPACETDLDWCAAECMLPLSCGELDCEFDPDMDCDGWGPWYDCYRRCQEPAECASDAECVQTVDCCAQQYVCAPVDELIDTCDIDCDPTEIPPSCLCQQGQCQNVSVCQHGLDRFFECGYTIGDYAGGHDEEMLRALQAGTCDATTQCYANCLANPTEDVCFSCHFGPADCLRDPFGECTERCAP